MGANLNMFTFSLYFSNEKVYMFKLASFIIEIFLQLKKGINTVKS